MTATASAAQPTFEELVWAEPIRSIAAPVEQVIETQVAPANEEPIDCDENLYFVPDYC